jgi:hypothetical protein
MREEQSLIARTQPPIGYGSALQADENARTSAEATAGVKALERQRESEENQSNVDRSLRAMEQNGADYEVKRRALDNDVKQAQYGFDIAQRKLDAEIAQREAERAQREFNGLRH